MKPAGRAARPIGLIPLLGMVLVAPGVAHAHGIGGRLDLPVPLGFFVAGAGVVLVLSFMALAVLWPSPRLQAGTAYQPLGRSRPLSLVLGGLGFLGLWLVVVAGWVGSGNASRNPAPVLVFVVFWLVVPFLSALLGDIYPAIDPWRWVRSAVGREQSAGPGSLWPAVVALFGFTWLELVAPDQGPKTLAVAALFYTGYLAVMAMLGRSDGDGFAAYNRLMGAIGPLATDDQGRGVVRRGWLKGLPALKEQPGLVALVAVMIGTVTYDGASATPWWQTSFGSTLTGVPATFAATIGLLAVTAVIGLAYLAASWLAARLGGAASTIATARRFAHTLVPIAFAYAFAHYFTLILFEGQLLLSTMSDPFGQGWDLFGTADRKIDFSLISGSTVWVWYVQVAVIVTGHVAGVVLAHDRALADFVGIRAVRSQYAMLALMVVLTGLGLVILAAG